MIDFIVESSLCTFCGDCASDCPAGIIELGTNLPYITTENENHCTHCQHCLAICPTGAISILGKDPSDSMPGEMAASADQVDALIRNRRTIRSFQQQNVATAKIDRLIRAAANAPTGRNQRKVMLTVIDDLEAMNRWKNQVIGLLENMRSEGRLTEKNEVFIKITKKFREGKDIIFRGAPHMVIATCPADAATPLADGLIALTYMELLAYPLGLGVVWAGYIMRILEMEPKILHELGIPENHVLSYVLLFGESARSYPRGVQRDEIEVNRPQIINEKEN